MSDLSTTGEDILILVMLHDLGNVVLHDIREFSRTELPRGDELGELLMPDQVVAPKQLARLASNVRDGVSIGEDEVALGWLGLVKLLRVGRHDLAKQRGITQDILVVLAVKGDVVGLRTEVEQPSFDGQVMQLGMCNGAQSPEKEKSEGQHADVTRCDPHSKK